MRLKNQLFVVLMIWVATGYGQLSFTQSTVASEFNGPAGLISHDINGDYKPDIICAGMDANSVGLWINNNDFPVTWNYIPVDENANGAIYVSAGDINGDDYVDIAVAAWDDGQITWYENNGANLPEFTKHIIKETFVWAHEVLVTDIDLDGDMDILGVSAGDNTIILFENTGGNPTIWTEHIITDDFAGARSVDAMDVDGDGDIDICGAALLDNEIAIWYNEGGSPIVWSKQVVSSDFIQSHKVQLIDIDNDGTIDILGTAYSSGIKWWSNNGADSITWETNNITGNATTVIAYAVDLDNDNDNDIIATAQGSGYVAYFENEGNNTLDFSFTYLEAFSGAWPLHYSDIDSDGDQDIIVGGNSADEIRLYTNDIATNLENTPYDEGSFRISPNPAKQLIKFDIPYKDTNKQSLLAIYDLYGNKVEEGNFVKTNDGVDVSILSPGIYFLMGKYNNTVYRSRFIKK